MFLAIVMVGTAVIALAQDVHQIVGDGLESSFGCDWPGSSVAG